ncbi:hypothetical protein DFQ27_006222 [Actinomortierella ambigua]|uniref:Uncharacterized protein n=1 Tax=Actinomortierella ambigua TaxID=1343610 RepID=A0A9P6U1F1_9FUNG|nr:hypothetical protein DFQ27_006222 [Actinomortierella ambigua]
MARLNIIRLVAFYALLSAMSYGFASEVVSGGDATNLLQEIVSRLDTGMPSGWELLVKPPDVHGSSYSEVISSKHLEQAVGAWNLDLQIRDRVYTDVQALIRLHAQEVTFASQRFQYNIPECNPGDLPVCTHTVIVVVRRAIATQDIVELHHLYMLSTSNAIQQSTPEETCRRCWLFRECCDSIQIPRPFTISELDIIQTVLSTTSARWALSHMQTITNTLSLSSDPSLHNDLSIPVQLRQFVRNNIENKDVFKEHDDELISAFQKSMQLTQRRTRSYAMSIPEHRLAVIGDMIAGCLKEANVEQSLEDLYRQAQKEFPGSPFSLECQNVKQNQVMQERPSPGCLATAEVTTDTQYFWVLLSPHDTMLESVFIESNVHAVHLQCVAPTRHKNLSEKRLARPNCHQAETQDSPQEGSVVRLSLPQQDGRFSSVVYLARLPKYTDELNKALMDIVRYAGAAAFLRMTISSLHRGKNSPDRISGNHEVHSLGFTDALAAIGKALAAIGDGWTKLSHAIGPHLSESVRSRICLGFERYQHDVGSFVGNQVSREYFERDIDVLLSLAMVKDKDLDKLRAVMSMFDTPGEGTYSGSTVGYTARDGFHRFNYFYKNFNETTNKIDYVFGYLASDFVLAADTLIVNKKQIGWLGLNHTETVEHRDVPHKITEYDTEILERYFEVIAYRHMAPRLNQPQPRFPSMDGVCSTS